MLDDNNVLKQRDPDGGLQACERLTDALDWEPEIRNPDHDGRPISSVIFVAMGGSAHAANMLAHVLETRYPISFEVSRDYDLPRYAARDTLVVAISYSGNTEETLSGYDQARGNGCEVAVITSSGELYDKASADGVATIRLPGEHLPRQTTIEQLLALTTLLEHFAIIDGTYQRDLRDAKGWLDHEAVSWHRDVPIHENYAKQFALITVGKTPLYYSGPLTQPAAYLFKTMWNETAKNLAFSSQYPEFSHTEFISWTSHPIDKPFTIIDLISDQERPRIAERMALSDRLLSGKRPKANSLHLMGNSLLRQYLWSYLFASYASTYTAILNGVNPLPVTATEVFKQKLAEQPSDTA